MDELFARFWQDVAGRVGGPMSFRLVLQPAMALWLGIRAGLQDGRLGRPPYGWAIFSDASHRRALLRDGWKAVAKVFTAAVVIDVVYQIIALGWAYPFEALFVAFVLACVPYLLIRGAVTRLTHVRGPVDRRDLV